MGAGDSSVTQQQQGEMSGFTRRKIEDLKEKRKKERDERRNSNQRGGGGGTVDTSKPPKGREEGKLILVELKEASVLQDKNFWMFSNQISSNYFCYSKGFGFLLPSNEVCSNYISPVGLFLCDFSPDAFDFSSSQTG